MKLGFIHKNFSNLNRNYFLISQVFITIIGLISGKLIALYILPDDFGLYNLQFAAYSFFSTLLIGPFIQFAKATNKSLLPKIGSRYYIYTISVIIVIAYILLISFLYFYFGLSNFTLFIILGCFVPLIALNSILGDYFTTNNRLITFSKFGIFKSLAGLLFLSLVLMLGLTWVSHIELLWLMQLFGAVASLIIFIRNYHFFKTKINIAYKTFFKKYFHFTGPLMFLAIWSWISNYFDRFALEYYLSVNEVGIYNASYGVGSKFFLLVSPIFLILLTPLVYTPAKREAKKQVIIKYSYYYIFFSIIALVAIYFVRDFVGIILLSDKYSEGFYLIFWVALAFFVLTLNHLFESIFYAEGKTRVILVASVTGATVNITLNILLIPYYGLLGAALATCAGFSVHFFVILINFIKL